MSKKNSKSTSTEDQQESAFKALLVQMGPEKVKRLLDQAASPSDHHKRQKTKETSLEAHDEESTAIKSTHSVVPPPLFPGYNAVPYYPGYGYPQPSLVPGYGYPPPSLVPGYKSGPQYSVHGFPQHGHQSLGKKQNEASRVSEKKHKSAKAVSDPPIADSEDSDSSSDTMDSSDLDGSDDLDDSEDSSGSSDSEDSVESEFKKVLFRSNPEGQILTPPRMTLPPGVQFSKQVHIIDWERRNEAGLRRVVNPPDLRVTRRLPRRPSGLQQFPDVSQFPLGNWPVDEFRYKTDTGKGRLNMAMMRDAIAYATGRTSGESYKVCEGCKSDQDSNYETQMCMLSSIWCKVARCFNVQPGQSYEYAWESTGDQGVLEVPEWYPDNYWL